MIILSAIFALIFGTGIAGQAQANMMDSFKTQAIGASTNSSLTVSYYQYILPGATDSIAMSSAPAPYVIFLVFKNGANTASAPACFVDQVLCANTATDATANQGVPLRVALINGFSGLNDARSATALGSGSGARFAAFNASGRSIKTQNCYPAAPMTLIQA